MAPMNPRLLKPTAARAVARTLYFNGAVSGNWAALGNWWNDAGHATQASRLPVAVDNVVITASVSSNSGNSPTVAAMTVFSATVGIVITVTGTATFTETAIHSGTLTGNATFNEQSGNLGTVVGNATFNGESTNGPLGVVTGTATFNDIACNDFGTAGTFIPNPPPSC